MKTMISLILSLMLAFSFVGALAQNMPPEMPNGAPPSLPGGTPPDGMPDGPGGLGGSQPDGYQSVVEVTEDTELTDELIGSTGTDENAIHVMSGTLTLDKSSVHRTSADSTGGDAASFYGVGAAVLATGGTAVIKNSIITTDAAGGAGVFAYGDGVAYVSDTMISTTMNTSGGIHVAGGGTLYAKNLTVTTDGESAAAIRSDRGSGTMVVEGGSYTANGIGSPAVYVTADITISDAELTATDSEALCLEGLNTVRLVGCELTGNMRDLAQNDNTWTVILYQSMSGDSEIGEGRFEMVNGSLTSLNGGLFYTTNTASEFVLSGVDIAAEDEDAYFLRVTGNANARGWGASGANGANAKFTAIDQAMSGDVIWDSISTLDMYMVSASTLTGAFVNDESCAGDGGSGYANLSIDEAATWVVTGNSVLTQLSCAGTVRDAAGNPVSVVGRDGTRYREGTSAYTVTVDAYLADCDLTNAATLAAQ